jgi:hypothetical protein
MRAVLEDAVRCLAGEIGPLRERRRLALEARRWVAEPDRQWPFSFENLCEGLGIAADRLRVRLLRSTASPPAPAEEPRGSAAPRIRREAPAEQDIVGMIRAGHPLRVVAETFGISISRASVLSCGLASRIKAARDAEIRQLRRAGWTHRALAKQFRLSRIRILRICARQNRSDAAA